MDRARATHQPEGKISMSIRKMVAAFTEPGNLRALSAVEKTVELHVGKFAKELSVKGSGARVRAIDEAAKPLTEEEVGLLTHPAQHSFHARPAKLPATARNFPQPLCSSPLPLSL
jgi:hypothetical protein